MKRAHSGFTLIHTLNPLKLLSSSLLLARIRGMEIRFHFSMLFSIPIAYYLFKPVTPQEYIIAASWLLGFTLCILLHELGHAVTARFFGVEVKSVVIWLLGGFTNLSRRADKPAHTLAISAAGPLVNMLLAFVFVMLYIVIYFSMGSQSIETFLLMQSFAALSFSLAIINLVLIVFNLLPIYPLDGGNILHALMEMLFGKSNADLITLIIGIPLLLCLLAFGVFVGDYLMVVSAVLIALALSTLNRSMLRRINLAANYFFKRGGYYYLQGDFDRAVQTFTADIDREPQQPAHYISRAACLLNLMQIERAKADADRALHLQPNNIIALQLRGELHLMDKDYDRALDFFNHALALNPNWGIAYFDRGSALMEQKQYSSALDEFNKAISFMPQHFFFYLVRSTMHFRLGDMVAARRDEDESLRLDEKNSLVMAEFNMILYEDYLDWAEEYYARVIAERPRLAYAYWGRADAYRVNKLDDKALPDYSRAIDLMPKEAQLYLVRGKSHQALNELEKARADFQTAITLTDKSHLKRQASDLLKLL